MFQPQPTRYVSSSSGFPPNNLYYPHPLDAPFHSHYALNSSSNIDPPPPPQANLPAILGPSTTACSQASTDHCRSNPLHHHHARPPQPQPQPPPPPPLPPSIPPHPLISAPNIHFSAHPPSPSSSALSSSHHPYSPVSIASTTTQTLSPFSCSVSPDCHGPSEMATDPTHTLPDDLAAQEDAARGYLPDLIGPLVGDKIPSHAITAEYAKADPVYVDKTVALPETYSHYRPIQGDGNCGWRAIGFAYFETLIYSGDLALVEAEISRITDLTQLLITVGGYDRYLFEDMVEETTLLLRDIADNLSSPNEAASILYDRFNDEDSANAIIYHLRLLACTWMKANPTPYEPFIPEDLGIDGYCSEYIERVNREIEQLGIMLLVNVLLKPANIVLEIAYLDRSPGSEVNIYRFPDEANGQGQETLGPFIYLLYRPDHYDILYRTPVSIQVNRVTSFAHDQEISNSTDSTLHSFTTGNFSALAMLPNFGPGAPALGALSGALSGALNGSSTTASCMDGSTSFSPADLSPTSWVAQQPFAAQSLSDEATVAGDTPPSLQVSGSTAAGTPLEQGPQQTEYPLRFSSQYYKLDNSSFPEQSFSTPTFKNSHYNKAHYNNPDFHPEEWSPEDDCPEKTSKRRLRARSD